ncbi:MAG: type II toxin-antitoxin system VapC family toxin [Anaerolineales bacterium]|nr:type II toxin-antitoxin system VapC family toxin [Anaerolineales bacterium]
MGSLLVSNHVFDETMTLVKKRLGMQVALQLGIRLRNSRFVEMVIFSAAEEQEVWRVFSHYTDKEWSYTDCACLVLARQRDIQQAFSFDHHFTQMGLVKVP